MKKTFTILLTILITANVYAQTPQKMSYQAVVRDANNNLVVSTQVGIQINILRDSINGTPVYTETQTPITNSNGLITMKIGWQTGFDTINWANGSYFLETGIDPTGGFNYSAIIGVSQLLSVPYALHATTADSVTGGIIKHYIGELFGGGIVFFVTPDGQHGLIASLEDLDSGNGALWGFYGINLTNCESMTNGEANTAAIIEAGGAAGEAAGLCNNYTAGGFNDWYLPSNRELCLLASHDILIDQILDNDSSSATNGFLQEHTIFGYSRYWTSTENTDQQYSYYYNFSGYTAGISSKNANYKVRAIRAF